MVALEHLDPREQVVAERDGDRALQVRVAGHRRVRLFAGAAEHDNGEPAQSLLGLGTRVEHVEPEGRRDLVVARSAGVDLPADLAEQALDRRVDVLVGLLEIVERDRRKPLFGVRELGVGEEARRVQPVRVEQRSLEVVGQQLVVVRAQEAPDFGRERGPDAARPERHFPSSSGSAGRLSRLCSISIRCVSAMSLVCTVS
jgi:hypothetical protein